ncbi:MAG: mechanosensitive ion channel domain-containing protein [Sedimenticolaceae bacterium]
MTKRLVSALTATLLVASLLFTASLVHAAEAAEVSKSPLLSSSLNLQRAEIERASNLSDAQKKQALSKVDEAQALLEQAEGFERRKEALLTLIRRGPETLAMLARQDATNELKLDLKAIEPWTNAQLEVVLSERQRQLEEMQKTLVEKDEVLDAYLAQTRSGGGELAELERRLKEVQGPSATGGPEGADPLAAAEKAWRDARARLLQARIDLLRLQQGNLSLLTDLARADLDSTASQVEVFQAHVSGFRDYLLERRQAAAEAVKQKAEENLSDAPAGIRGLEQAISRLAAENAELVAQEAGFERQNERISRTQDQVKRDYERIQQIVELGGASAQVSSLLQKRRALVPLPKVLNRQAIEYQEQLSDAGLRQLELDEVLQEPVDGTAQIDRLLGESGRGANAPELAALRQSAREAWGRYRDATLDLWKTYNRYIGKLSKLEADTRSLAKEASTYRRFINDRLLWVPSTELIPLAQPALLIAGLRWLVEPSHLEQLSHDSLSLLRQHGPATAFWAIGLVALFGLRRRAVRGLKLAAAATGKVRTDSFGATLAALGHTLALILLLPWFFIGSGLLLGGLTSAAEYTLVVAAGLQSVGHALLFLGMLRQLCRSKGLAVAHLLWQPELCAQLSRQAAWLMPLLAPLAFLAGAGAASVPSGFVRLASAVQDVEPGLLSLGRLALIAQMLLLGIAIHRVWRSQGPVMRAFASTPERIKWTSYHIAWFGPALMIPALLALAALIGFFYTAAFLTAIAGQTLWFIVALVLFKDLLIRGLYVTQRRLRFEEALRYREETQAQRAASDETGDTAATDGTALQDEKINYLQLGDQARQLINLGYTIALLSGLWWIWSDIVPAFGFLNQVELPIGTSKLVDGVSKDVPLTLGDMVAGLLLGGLALFAARNVPALLELTLLRRLPMSRASRYAVTTLTQYLVAMLGLVITFKALGLQWSSIQWLVAALSVGLGFGLQEIVANFVSGIILLFEQPIRVGDVVTVDETTGTVTRIRIRATTIVNWERQELIVPNKSFITGRLINWTLSDTVNRVLITVGVDYKADTRHAMQLMKQAAAEHPKVLDDPPPRITFEGFGDNALTLNMRAYLGDIDARLDTITELHQLILDKFRDAGIGIAFPQRDVHLDTNGPIELLLRRGAKDVPGDMPSAG